MSAGEAELAPYLQCVPYARERTGVQIYGDARTWWDQAAGRYRRGNTPRPGAVMTFMPTGSMVLGHVAAVSKVIDSRTVLLDHANWSPIDGRRGQIERDVRAVDVSPANDWSQVRVWYAPLGNLGTTAWPVAGFIYNEREDGTPLGRKRVFASASSAPASKAFAPAPSSAFAAAFKGFADPVMVKPTADAPRRIAASTPTRPRDPIDAAIALYGS
nr:CHAP domain-containing protein [Tsuneonella dongtanensis]